VSDAIDLRPEFGAVRDQGARGTCLAFAVTAAHERARHGRRGSVDTDLGEELLYWACKQIDGDHTPGTYPGSAAKALTDTGQSAAALWPYDSTRSESDPNYTPPADALADAEMRRATLNSASPDLDNLRDLLRLGHTIVLGLELWPQFYDAPGGDLGSPSPADLLGDAHAVALVGFDDDDQELLLRNSWGAEWGDDGHGSLPYGALSVVCRGAWVLEDDIDS
jgi:C1A family cysteine protease